ncbi:hypothetical protein Pint_03662 [Pistacia integerrima]|uniref:Uncharacterized protein n=1 Tax=Pistacia integerrima TaxID=434235 RepID=A0ACC0Z348_9ROSI|nr:hypothetical protein Pint_03662 [Pistacia integerrima]
MGKTSETHDLPLLQAQTADSSFKRTGEKRAWICGFFVQISLYGTAIAYTVTSAISMRYVADIYIKEALLVDYVDNELFVIRENGYAKGSISGVSTSSSIQKLSLVSQGLGDIAFAFPFVLVLIEVQVSFRYHRVHHLYNKPIDACKDIK